MDGPALGPAVFAGRRTRVTHCAGGCPWRRRHAWIEFYCEAHGWVPFDPTHNREIDERYVVVLHGRYYDDVPPNKGIYRGDAKETLHAEVHTEISVRKPISTLYEEIRQIDLPVYQELSDQRIHRLPNSQAEAAAQQQ